MKTLTLKIDATGFGSVQLDSENLQDVSGIDIRIRAGELTTATIIMSPDLDAVFEVERLDTIKPSFQRAGLDELLANAVKAFNELTPDQRRFYRDAQRKSWCVGELCLAHPEMTAEEAEAIYNCVVSA